MNLEREHDRNTEHYQQKQPHQLTTTGRDVGKWRSNRSDLQQVRDPVDQGSSGWKLRQIVALRSAQWSSSDTEVWLFFLLPLLPVCLQSNYATCWPIRDVTAAHGQNDGQTQKEGSIVLISRSMWRIRPVKQPEKLGSSCPDAAPADVKLSRQTQKTQDIEINLWKSREQLNIVRELTEHFKAFCHTYNGSTLFFQNRGLE